MSRFHCGAPRRCPGARPASPAQAVHAITIHADLMDAARDRLGYIIIYTLQTTPGGKGEAGYGGRGGGGGGGGVGVWGEGGLAGVAVGGVVFCD